MAKRVTAEELQKFAFEKFNGNISIYEDTFINMKHKVKCHCSIHNYDFWVYAYQIKQSQFLCQKCANEYINSLNIKPWEEVFKEFTDKYGTRFSYEPSTYNGMKKEMKVHCNECGETFYITPIHHLKYNNGGCPNCHKYTTVKCAVCGKDIIVDRHLNHATNILCEECRKINKKLKQKNAILIEKEKVVVHKCKICGRLYTGEHCENDFCNNINEKRLLALKVFNFDISKIGTIEVEEEYNRIRNILYDMYWTQHMSSFQICDYFGISYNKQITKYHLKYLNIPIKSISESQIESIQMGRTKITETQVNLKFKSGHHISWDGCDYFLRSSFEFDYAEKLDNLKIHYEVETLKIEYFDTQRNRYRIAIPDFYISETNTIVEIKSSYTLNLQNMIDKRKAYIKNGYKFRLIVNKKEVNIDDLNPEDFKKCYKSNSKFSLAKTHPGKSGWKWMNNGTENLQIKKEDIQIYINSGWKFGKLSKNTKRNSGFVYKWMNNGFEQKQITSDDIQSYLNMGWTFGILNRSKTRWMNNGSETKRVSFDKVQKYIDEGWKIGSLKDTNKKWLNNGNKAIRVKESELQNYLDDGWVLGRKTENTSQ